MASAEKRAKLQRCKSRLAKLSKGISLRVNEKDSISYVRELREEMNECWKEFEFERNMTV
jgi:hypothetical protein